MQILKLLQFIELFLIIKQSVNKLSSHSIEESLDLVKFHSIIQMLVVSWVFAYVATLLELIQLRFDQFTYCLIYVYVYIPMLGLLYSCDDIS